MCVYFDKPGKDNTEKALDAMVDAIKQYGIKQVVVASTYGSTGLEAAEKLKDMDVNLVVVTHNVGFKQPGTIEMSPDMKAKLESLGAIVYTGTMPFRSIGTSIREKQGYSQQDLIANTLRILGQGLKVCVEIAMMASDAGLITPDDVICVAGTARGADTVVQIAPKPSNMLFDLKVKRVLAKPVNW